MDRKHIRFTLPSVFLVLSLLIALGFVRFSTRASAATSLPPIGHVYVLTSTVNNAIVTLNRYPDGSLTYLQTTPIGGSGNGMTAGKQGSLQVSHDGHWLFAVDSQSNQIAVVAIQPSGALVPTTLVSSGGIAPVSLTESNGILYIANNGDFFAHPANVVGFSVGTHGSLTLIPGSVHTLTGIPFADVGEIQASPDGTTLMVTQPTSNKITSFQILSQGNLSAGTSFSPSGSRFPLAFSFLPMYPQHYVMSGVVSLSPSGASGSLSSYSGSALLSGPVLNQQTYPRRVGVTGNGNFAYLMNSDTSSVSAYQIEADRNLTLISSTPTGTGLHSLATELALDPNNPFLYVIVFDDSGTSIVGFRILPTGNLIKIGGFGAGPLQSGGAGMVVVD